MVIIQYIGKLTKGLIDYQQIITRFSTHKKKKIE